MSQEELARLVQFRVQERLGALSWQVTSLQCQVESLSQENKQLRERLGEDATQQ